MPNHDATYPRTSYKGKGKQSTVRYRLRLDEDSYVLWTRLAWALLLYYNECHVWKSAMKRCRRASPSYTRRRKDGEVARVALIGDPQLVDDNTYARRGLAMKATQFYTDAYMRRNYRYLQSVIRPDLVIFTGDLFDGGREWEDGKWEAELRRFRTVFPAGDRVIDSLPGNHDIGMADGVKSSVLTRFVSHFGETSRVVAVGGWDIVLLDTVSLSSSDKQISASARRFLTSISTGRDGPSRPRVLVTHVPLYRPADGACGPLRESKNSILIQQGHQYQNVLTPEISNEVWETVRPSVVFAGDDHDYCDYVHDDRTPTTNANKADGGVHEINVKSFSWAMGIQHPGFQMLELHSPVSVTSGAGSGTNTHAGDLSYDTRLCLVPGQLPIFLHYAIALALTVVGAIWVRRRGRARGRTGNTTSSSNGTINGNGGRQQSRPHHYAFRLAVVPVLIYITLLYYTSL